RRLQGDVELAGDEPVLRGPAPLPGAGGSRVADLLRHGVVIDGPPVVGGEGGEARGRAGDVILTHVGDLELDARGGRAVAEAGEGLPKAALEGAFDALQLAPRPSVPTRPIE